jgi:hypothetical protein
MTEKQRTRWAWEPRFDKPPGRVLFSEDKVGGNFGVGHTRTVSRKDDWLYESIRQLPFNKSMPDMFYRRYVPERMGDEEALAYDVYAKEVWDVKARAWLSATKSMPYVKEGSEEWRRIKKVCGLA